MAEKKENGEDASKVKLVGGEGSLNSASEDAKTAGWLRAVRARMQSRPKVAKEWITFTVGDPQNRKNFIDNEVTTSKYTVLTLVPLNLLEQFRRIANFYFLIISILQLTTDLSPTNRFATVLPLTVVLLVTMIKEALEDVRRHRADDVVNNSKCLAYSNGAFVRKRWKELIVGDIVQLHNHESVPADVVLLASGSPQGVTYVETSNLDGETNLKLKQSLADTMHLDSPEKLTALRASMHCLETDADLYEFKGTLTIGGDQQVAVGLSNVVWRGCRIENTPWCFALVVYTGQDTKLIQNSRKAPAKRSEVERIVDKAIILIFVTLAIMCSVSTLFHVVWLDSRSAQGVWYLPFVATRTDVDTALTWVTFLILYNNLVPISLYVSLEVVKLAQARLISWDAHMYHAASDTPATARTSNLNEDLGQVEYIFSDKTGTLTCNEMEFKKCSVGGMLYGGRVVLDGKTGSMFSNELQRKVNELSSRYHRRVARARAGSGTSGGSEATMAALAAMQVGSPRKVAPAGAAGAPAAFSQPPLAVGAAPGAGTPAAAAAAAARHQPNAPSFETAAGLLVAGASNSQLALPNGDGRASQGSLGGDEEKHNPAFAITTTTFESSSTYFEASAAAAGGRKKTKGYNFDDTEFRTHLGAKDAQAEKLHRFLLCLATCHTVIPEVDVETKQVFYQASSPDEGALVIAARELGYDFYFRGSKVLQLRTPREGEHKVEVLAVNEFHSDRKRMSVLARDKGRYILFCKGADEVMVPLLRDKDDPDVVNMLNHLYEFGSEGLRTLVLGCVEVETARAEDWLRRHHEAANSPDRTRLLRAMAAEIERDFELVGATAIEDKLQDGVPQTVRLLSRAGIKVWMLTGDKLETAQNIAYSASLLTDDLELIKIDESDGEAVSLALARAVKKHSPAFVSNSEHLAMIISGQALARIMPDKELSAMLLALIKACKVVVACRVIPSQKAQLVTLVRTRVHPEPVTMAVGDGANDVAMIQEAHVGIGISGNEGMQAVRASDYSIAQFRYLQRLLLVHGRWNYKRVSLLILYSFYKNIANVLTLFFFGFSNGFSGTTLYESWLGAGWNVGWTLFPVLAYGIFEKDLDADVALRNPECYRHGQRHSEFNVLRMGRWLINAAVHAIIIYFLAQRAFLPAETVGPDGLNTGLFLMGTMINACTVLTVNYKIMLETHNWVVWNWLALIGSFVIWVAFVVIYSRLISVGWDFFGIASQIFTRPFFYALIALVPVAAIVPDLTFYALEQQFFPSQVTILREKQLLAKREAKRHGHAHAVDFVRQFEKERKLREDDDDRPELQREISTTVLSNAHVPFEHMLADKVIHLRRVLSRDESAINKPKSIIEAGRQRVSALVKISPVTLEFEQEPQLEREFRRQYVIKSLGFIRISMVVLFLLITGYTVYSVAISEEKAVFRIVATGLALIILGFVYTRIFRMYYTYMMFLILLAAGFARSLLVTDSGTIGLGMYIVVVLLIMRLRFIMAVIVVLIDLAFYAVYVTAVTDIVTWVVMLRIVFLELLLVIFAGVYSYKQERSLRIDFLLQRDYEAEKARNQEIIDNIMPTYITRQLRTEAANANTGAPANPNATAQGADAAVLMSAGQSNVVIANNDGEVSILFCDLVGFTDFVAKSAPSALVAIMDSVYSIFDLLCDKGGVQKMETVGKTYMACAGLQGTRADHAIAVAELAQAMLEVVALANDPDLPEQLNLRIGIHTGKVISGIVGLKRPQFSLFGDTVNTASRMQSTGVDGRVQISASTYEAVRHDYHCEARPELIEVKGKGKMQCYLLGERLTKIPKHRIQQLVRKEQDKSVVEEARKIISAIDAAVKFDPYTNVDRTQRPIKLDQRNLRFRDQDHERQYVTEIRKTSGQRARLPLALAFLFIIGEGFFEFGLDDEFVRRGTLEKVYAIRATYAAVCVLAFAFSYTRLFARNGAVYLTVVFGLGALSSVQIMLLKDDSAQARKDDENAQVETRACLSAILFMTLLSNTGVMRFVPTLLVNLVGVVVWYLSLFEAVNDSKVTFLLFFVIASFVINSVASYGREFYQRREFVLTRQVKDAKDGAENLLYAMLPQSVAEQLKLGRLAIAEEYNGVTILYSDIRGFTKYAASATPQQVVTFLAGLFVSFDRKCDEYNVYKVQTIGDAYVLVGGFPFIGNTEQTPEDHADNVVKMGMYMLEVVASARTHDDTVMAMRVGVHTGRLIAGCIGTKTLRYDIWGSDCIVANALESNGVPGGICVSDRTRWYLETRYVMKDHKKISVKGAAEIQTFVIVHSFAEPNRKLNTEAPREADGHGDSRPPDRKPTRQQGLAKKPTLASVVWEQDEKKEGDH